MKVFITGATTGIGLEVAKLYLSEGHQVALCGRELGKLPSEFEPIYPKSKLYQVDVLEKEKLASFITEFSQGELDLVIANAGISMGVKSRLPDFDSWRRVIDTNIHGVINTFEPALKIMIPKKKGHLVAMSSVAGFNGLPGAGPYSASKAAVKTFSESLSIDLKREGIDVTTICPGFIDTPLTRKNPHPMPWLMDVTKGAKLIKKAIDKKKAIYLFPWQMKIVVLFLSYLPRSLYKFIMTVKLFNFSKE